MTRPIKLGHARATGRRVRRRARWRRSRRPSGSASTRCGRPRPTGPTPSRRSRGGAPTTERIRLGTGIAQLSARTPAATAMAAMTLDHLSGGRFILGLGASGPQVVEGWYGQPYPRPLARTREYVDIVRQTSPAASRSARRRVLRPAAAGRHRARQGAQVDRPPAAHRHPDLPRRRGAEERRPRRRDRRRLAAAVLRPEGGRVLPRLPRRGLRRQRRRRQGGALRGGVASCRSSSATTSSGAPTSCAR